MDKVTIYTYSPSHQSPTTTLNTVTGYKTPAPGPTPPPIPKKPQPRWLLNVVLVVVMMGWSLEGWGQILTFEFSSLGGSEATASSNSNDPNLTSSTISRGAGLTASANGGRFNATSWALTSIANAISGNDYMEFTITPNSGYQFSVSSIVIQLQRSATGPRAIALRSSVDGYANNLDVEKTIADNTDTQTFTFNFSQANSIVPVTYRMYMYAEATTGSGGPGDGTGNDIVVNGAVTMASSNDTDTEVFETTPQIASGIISSTSTAFTPVFSFEIEDQSSGDNLPTQVTNIRLKPAASNTADWTDHLNAVRLNNGTITTGTPVITDTYIDIPITSGNLNIAEGVSQTITLEVQINNTGITDNSILSFNIDADNHGFTADAAGSGFASEFTLGDVVSNNFTIDVTLAEIRFLQQPPSSVLLNSIISPAVTVAATDEHGNIDVDFSGSGAAIGLTTNGTFSASSTTEADAVNGIATFDNLVFSVEGTGRTLTTTNPDNWGYTNITSNPFDIVDGPCLEEGFDGGTSEPSGWIFTNIGDTYTSSTNYGESSPSIKFDNSNESIETPEVTNASELSFWIKGQSTNALSAFLVEGWNGSSWITIENITNSIPTTGTVYTYNSESSPALASGFTKFRFTYTKGQGNLAFDDVKVFCVSQVCDPPTTQASSISSTGLSNNSINLSWSAGDGARSMVIVKEGSAVDAFPDDNTTYLAEAAFGDGSEIGTGNFVVYSGSDESFTLTGLQGGTTYHVAVVSYNCTGGGEKYLTASPATYSFTTRPAPVSNLQISCTNSNTATITWTNPTGNYDGIVIGVREDATPHSLGSIDPASITANATFGSGYEYGSTTPYSFAVYKGTGNEVIVTFPVDNTPYTVMAYSYQGTTWADFNPTRTIQSLGVPDINNLAATALNGAVEVNWANPSSLCFDEVILVAHTSTISGTPAAIYNTNSPDYTDVNNPNFPGGGKVVYSGTSNFETVTGLTNGTAYYFKVFVRNGPDWSTGEEITATPTTVTILDYADLAILGINTQYLGSGGDDEIILVMFKDFTVGSTLDFTDNGYEREIANYWGTTEGVIRLERLNSTLTAGTVVTIRGVDDDFEIFVNGSLDNNWNVTSLNGNYSFNLNSTDQLWIMQGGNWSSAEGTHRGTYSGKVLFGWSAIGWQAAPGYASTSGSTLYPGSDCSNTNVTGLSDNDKVKYTGDPNSATRREWIGRINESTNWTGYSTNTLYNSGGSFGISLSIDPSPDGDKWIGDSGTDWFNCSNWGSLRVPDIQTNVIVDRDAGSNISINNPAEIAYMRSLTLDNSSRTITVSGTSTVINIDGDVTINSGDSFTVSDGVVNISGDIDNSGNFSQAAGTVSIVGNLFNNSIFSVPNGEIELNGTQIQQVTSVSDLVVYELTINNASGVEIDNDVTATVLNMQQGNVTMHEGSVFQIGQSSTNRGVLNYTAGHISGLVRRWFTNSTNTRAEGLFPLPNSAAVLFTIPPSAGGTLTAEFINVIPDGYLNNLPVLADGININTLSDNGFWRITEGSGLNSGQYSISLDATGFPGINTPEGIRILKSISYLYEWNYEGDYGSYSGNIFTQNSMSGFSDFTLGGDSNTNPLPVELLTFDATWLNDVVELHWSTATEINNDFFTLERTADFRVIDVLGNIAGAGNSNTALSYSFTDTDPLAGISYYRLKQTDFDGSFEYSDWVAVSGGSEPEDGLEIVSAWSRNERMTIQVRLNPNQASYLEVFDLFGRRIAHQELAAGQSFAEVVMDNPVQGVVLIRLYNASEWVSEKVIGE